MTKVYKPGNAGHGGGRFQQVTSSGTAMKGARPIRVLKDRQLPPTDRPGNGYKKLPPRKK